MKSSLKIFRGNVVKATFAPCIIHVLFFWFRLGVFIILRMISDNTAIKEHVFRESFGDFIYLAQFNACPLYSAVKAVVDTNTMAYILATCLMFHNTVLSMFVATFAGMSNQAQRWIALSILSFSFFLEGLYSLYTSYSRRYEFQFQLFKKIGIDEVINSAYATRKCLEIFGGLNFFITFSIASRFIDSNLITFINTSYVVTLYVVVSFIQQIFASVKLNEENIRQRKIAIGLSIFKIAIGVWVIINDQLFETKDPSISPAVDIVLFADAILLSCAQHYFLVADCKKFGSGLKKYLAFKAVQLNMID